MKIFCTAFLCPSRCESWRQPPCVYRGMGNSFKAAADSCRTLRNLLIFSSYACLSTFRSFSIPSRTRAGERGSQNVVSNISEPSWLPNVLISGRSLWRPNKPRICSRRMPHMAKCCSKPAYGFCPWGIFPKCGKSFRNLSSAVVVLLIRNDLPHPWRMPHGQHIHAGFKKHLAMWSILLEQIRGFQPAVTRKIQEPVLRSTGAAEILKGASSESTETQLATASLSRNASSSV